MKVAYLSVFLLYLWNSELRGDFYTMFTNYLVMYAFLRLNSEGKSVKIIFELCGKRKEQEFI